MITRLAPTPSGFLHLGNAVNFQLIAWLAASKEGEVVLRIDDMDAPRYRPEYVDDVFDLLDWMGIAWHRGPRTRGEFETEHSLTHRTAHYRSALDRVRDNGLECYACSCTRSSIAGVPTGGCSGGCRAAQRHLETGVTALRLHVPVGTVIPVQGRDVHLADAVGDFVVWRRDGLPAYHLACVVEDEALATTHVVRGEDLRESTAAQLFLARHLGADAFLSAEFLHHPLLTDEGGRKLSKSQLSGGEPLARSRHMLARIHAAAAALAPTVGIIAPD